MALGHCHPGHDDNWGAGVARRPEPSSRREQHHEAGTDHAALGVAAVLRADGALVRLDDLLRYREAKAAVGTEFLAGGALGVEAVEDRLQLALGDARTLVLDRDADEIALALGGDPDGAARRAKRDRVGDEVAEHLAEAALHAEHGE